jgi:hypothetical protein
VTGELRILLQSNLDGSAPRTKTRYVHIVIGNLNPVQAVKACGNKGGIFPLILNFYTTQLNAWFHGCATLPPTKKNTATN